MEQINNQLNPSPFKIKYRELIEKELEENRELNGLLLTHGYIEFYLSEWLDLYNTYNKKIKIIKKEEHLTFKTILLIHKIMGNISPQLYSEINNLNQERNKWAHDLISLNNDKEKNKIRKTIKHGINVCDKIYNLYTVELDKKQKNINIK